MLVGPLEGSFLRLLVKMTGARRILEIGTFTGYSALCMAEALPEGGTVVTLDYDEDSVKIAQEYWQKSPHGSKIVPVPGNAVVTLDTVERPFDMVFIDADKENYEVYWEKSLDKTRQGGLIVVDNVLWSGRALSPHSQADHSIARFNDRVAADKRVDHVMLTVRDGLTLAVKK